MKYVFSKELKTEYTWDDIKERLFLSVCFTKEAAAIKGLLYEEIGPIALVPRFLIYRDNEETRSGSFVRDSVRELKATPEEILAQAKKNGEKLFPTSFIELKSMFLVSSFDKIDPDKRKPCAFGGAQLFYDGNLAFFKKILGSDYYIIPANRFEMLLSPVTEDISAFVLMERLKVINGTKSKTPEWAKFGNFILLYKDGKLSVAAEE